MKKPIIELIQQFSPNISFRHYWGAIPSLPGSGPTPMHRDIYPFLNISKGCDLDSFEVQLPPYYFTVFIPLVEINEQNGPTEFVKGTHRLEKADNVNTPIFAPLLSPGDVIIFDGRLMHRGTPNQSKDEKLIAYITFVANWYHDQTFAINDYLFPELSAKGH